MSTHHFERRGNQLSERSSLNGSGGRLADTPFGAFSQHAPVESDQPPPVLEIQQQQQQQWPTPGQPAWAVATDVFWERYGSTSTQDIAWTPLPYIRMLSGQSAASSPPPQPEALSSLSSSSERFSRAATAGATGHVEPWLLHAFGSGPGSGVSHAGLSSERPRGLLFQYKPYSQQEALSLSASEVEGVVDAVFGRLKEASTARTMFEEGVGFGGGSGKNPGQNKLGTSSPPAPAVDSGATTTTATATATHAVSCASRDVASVVLIKLIIDMYLRLGPRASFPLVLYLLQKPLLLGTAAARCRVFDLISNLAVHAELLRAAPADDVPEDNDEVAEAVAGLDPSGPSGDWRTTVTSALRASLAMESDGHALRASSREGTRAHVAANANADDGNRNSTQTRTEGSAVWPPLPHPLPPPIERDDPQTERFRQWLRLLLFRLLSVLCSVGAGGDRDGGAWATGLSSLIYLTTYDGRVVRAYIEELPLNVVARLLEEGKERMWPETLRCMLGVLAVNLLYALSPPPPRSLGQIRTATTSDTAPLYDYDYAYDSASSKPRYAPASLQTPGAGASAEYSAEYSGIHRTGGAQYQREKSLTGTAVELNEKREAMAWKSAQIDVDRLEAFGGIQAVVRFFREAPTVRSIRAFFCVLFDYAATTATTAAGNRPSANSLTFLRGPSGDGGLYASVRAVGGALYHIHVAEAVHSIATSSAGRRSVSTPLQTPTSPQRLSLSSERENIGEHTMLRRIADSVSAQLIGKSVVPAVIDPHRFVQHCFNALERVLSVETTIPADLQLSFEATLQEICGGRGPGTKTLNPEPSSMETQSPPPPPPSAPVALESGADWSALADALRDGSPLGKSLSVAWLQQLLIASAEIEIAAAFGSGSMGEGLATQPVVQPPCALLPAPDIRTASWKTGAVRTLENAPVLKQLFSLVLPDPSGAGAAAFVSAVKGLLDYLRLRAAGLLPTPSPSIGKDGLSESLSSSWHAVHAPSVALATLIVAVDWLALAPAGVRRGPMVHAAECLVSWLVVRTLDADCTPRAACCRAPTEDSQDDFIVMGGGGEGGGGPWGNQTSTMDRDFDHRVAPLDTLSQLQGSLCGDEKEKAPESPPPTSLLNTEAAAPADSTSSCAGTRTVPTGTGTSNPSVGTIPSSRAASGGSAMSPISKIMPVPKIAAAWRRLTAPHTSSKTQPAAAPSQEREASSVRPLSAGMAAIGGVPAPGSAAELHTSLNPKSPVVRQNSGGLDPSVQPVIAPAAAAGGTASGDGIAGRGQQAELLRQERRALAGGHHTLFDAAMERLAADDAAAAVTTHAAATALAEAEISVGPVGSFLGGLSTCPRDLLLLADPGYLRAVFDAMRLPDVELAAPGDGQGHDFQGHATALDGHSPSRSPPLSAQPWAAGRKAPAAGTHGRAIPTVHGRACAVQTWRPLWDARAALLALLLARCSIVEEEEEVCCGDGESREVPHRVAFEGPRNNAMRKSSKSADVSGGGAVDSPFIASLLSDADVRVRRQASVFVLHRMAQQGTGRYRAAMRAVVAKAQRSGDERLLLSPEAQVQAMREMRLLNL